MNKVIGISGTSGAGKTTLVQALSKNLNTARLHWDDFDQVSQHPRNYLEWYDAGQDYREFDYSELANALKTLKLNQAYTHPISNIIIKPTPIIFADLPLGRRHTQTERLVDLFIHVDVPLDIALCRRITRNPDVYNFEELENYQSLRKLYIMEDVRESSDFILDGKLKITDLVSEVGFILKRTFG